MSKYLSRKFIVAVTTIVILIVVDVLDKYIGLDMKTEIVSVAMVYILGQGAVDVMKASKGEKEIEVVSEEFFNDDQAE